MGVMDGKPDIIIEDQLIDMKIGRTKTIKDMSYLYDANKDEIPKLMGKSVLASAFQNWTITYNNPNFIAFSKAMKVYKRGWAQSMLNKTPAKMSIRFFEEHKDRHLPNKDNYSVSLLGAGLSLNNLYRYKGCPIKKYNYEIIDPYAQHIEFILTLDCESYRDALKLAHKLKRLKTINSVEVQIDTLKFK
jgi:hypothetical protein